MLGQDIHRVAHCGPRVYWPVNIIVPLILQEWTGSSNRERRSRWTQEADRALMDVVRECEFDFEEVATRLSQSKSVVVDAAVVDSDVALTAEDCRVRYTHLDMLEGVVAFGSGSDESCDDEEKEEDKRGGESFNDRGGASQKWAKLLCAF